MAQIYNFSSNQTFIGGQEMSVVDLSFLELQNLHLYLAWKL